MEKYFFEARKIIILVFIYLLYQKDILISLKFLKSIFNIIDISIIIPIYNSEKYLPLCLNSVINQTLFNIEIICINDGSTDNSLPILKEYQNKVNRIKIIDQQNKGSGIARNNGIKISKGKFITFMDSDDLYPNKFALEFIFKKANENKVFICGGGIRSFVENNSKIRFLNIVNNSFYNNSLLNYSNYQYDYYYQRFIYNKNFIKRNKLYFPNYLRYQDPPFFIKTMGKAKKFYALKNITYFYRVYNKNKTMNERKITDIYKGIRDCLMISKSMHLYKLYYLVLTRLNTKIFITQAKKFKNNKNLKKIISKILYNIDYGLLKKQNLTFIKDKFYNYFIKV